MPQAKLFLIDAHALCYRAFFAIRGLATSKGQATNAIFGFVNTLKKILKDHKPAYLAVCFDSPEVTHRQQKFAAYKIQRPQMPVDLIDQIPVIKEIVKAYNLAAFEYGGFEADDIIATISKRASQDGLEVVIVSDDKDMYQLANPGVSFLNTRQDTLAGYHDIKQRLGFEPQHMTDFIGLAGDSSDNIPGVKGIGETTATDLIQKYGSLDNIFRHLAQIQPAKIKEKIEAQHDSALLSRELAVLDTAVPLDFDLDHLKVKTPDHHRLLELFKDLEFKKFARELQAGEEKSSELTTLRLQEAEDIEALIQRIRENGRFAFLLRQSPSEELPLSAQLIIALGEKETFEIPLNQKKAVKELFEDKKTLKITHHVKEAFKILAEQDCAIQGDIFDVMVAGYLLGLAQTSLDPAGLAWNYFKTSLGGQNTTAQEACVIDELYPLMVKELKEKSLLNLFNDMEMPLAYVLFRMEKEGVTADVPLLKGLSKECDRKIQELTARIYQLAGEEFNLNSPKQLSHVLFQRLKLPVVKKTKTGFSTDEGVLTVLAEEHAVPSLILEYRQLAKLKSTYIDALPKLINPATGRIHAQFDQTGTETGRLSSSHPNLQNIPIRTELGRQIRRAIIPSQKNRMIMAADYSQIELRILAHLSGDQTLIKAFQQDEDIHRFTASLMFNVKENQVTPQMRDSAKRVNFGIIYGMSAFGLAKDLKISQEEAQEFIDRYFLRYPDVQRFMARTISECEDKGFVVTLLNRRRYIPEIKNTNTSIQQFAQRQAVNTPVQGSAADLMKLTMIAIQRQIEQQKLHSRMLITVHDELVFDVPTDEKKKMSAIIRQCMEHPLPRELSVPIKVTIKAGPNWLDMEEV